MYNEEVPTNVEINLYSFIVQRLLGKIVVYS